MQAAQCGGLAQLLVPPARVRLRVGYQETEAFDAARKAMAATEVNERWQRDMAGFFEQPEVADEAMVPLVEVFHLA
ncbi:L-rhamnose mutarotase [Streptomyces sp. NPDC127066]|uniref:L-rhamnose mutarotase n=1 Tax=Streptomyces sp. NPDC127066 TaxID=3347125 RepID=UPI00364D68B6